MGWSLVSNPSWDLTKLSQWLEWDPGGKSIEWMTHHFRVFNEWARYINSEQRTLYGGENPGEN